MIRRATIVAVGKMKGWAADGCQDYLRRLEKHFAIQVVEVLEEDMNRRSPEEVLAAESDRILKRLPEGAYVIALDRESGEQLPSDKLALRLASLGTSGRSHVAVVIGGPLGLSREVLERADARISFGKITLPHALARVVLLEQLYRAVKIERGEKYHW